MIAAAKSLGASCGTLWPIPSRIRWETAREHLPVGCPVLGRPVEIATDRDGGTPMVGLAASLASTASLCVHLGQPEPPPIVVYDDVDMVGAVEGAERS